MGADRAPRRLRAQRPHLCNSGVGALWRCRSRRSAVRGLGAAGRLLRNVFLADYFVNGAFRRKLLRVLNRGESANSFKRSIYVGRVAGYRAKQHNEMQAVADALSLLANLVMAWNTMKMQLVMDRWNTRRSTTVPPELIGRIGGHVKHTQNTIAD